MHSVKSKQPSEFNGTQIKDLLWCFEPSVEVFASKQIQSACMPFVMNVFWPFMIRSSPDRFAVVCEKSFQFFLNK